MKSGSFCSACSLWVGVGRPKFPVNYGGLFHDKWQAFNERHYNLMWVLLGTMKYSKLPQMKCLFFSFSLFRG